MQCNLNFSVIMNQFEKSEFLKLYKFLKGPNPLVKSSLHVQMSSRRVHRSAAREALAFLLSANDEFATEDSEEKEEAYGKSLTVMPWNISWLNLMRTLARQITQMRKW